MYIHLAQVSNDEVILLMHVILFLICYIPKTSSKFHKISYFCL